MRAACSKCGYQLESLIIDKSVALQDISKKLNRHLESQHKDMVLAMGSALQTGATALLFVAPFAEFVFVPEEEEYVQEKLQEAKDIVMALLGYDPEVEEEEEDDNEDLDDDSVYPDGPENPSTNVEDEPDTGTIEFNDSIEPDSGSPAIVES